MLQSETNGRLRLSTCLGALLLLFAIPSAGFAQGWEIPEGAEGAGGPPHTFPSLAGAGEMVGPIEFTEAEFPAGTQVDGLSVDTVGGVDLPATLSFGFTVGGVPSTDATIGLGPPPQMFVIPPGFEGDAAGTLSIDFGVNVTTVEFGFALSCLPPPVSPGTTVTAFDASDNVVGVLSVDAVDTGNIFIENLVQFSPGTFRRIEATWNDSCGARFLFDNLSYIVGDDPTIAVPTLGAAGVAVLVALLLITAVAVMRRRARA